MASRVYELAACDVDDGGLGKRKVMNEAETAAEVQVVIM